MTGTRRSRKTAFTTSFRGRRGGGSRSGGRSGFGGLAATLLLVGLEGVEDLQHRGVHHADKLRRRSIERGEQHRAHRVLVRELREGLDLGGGQESLLEVGALDLGLLV